MGVGEGRWWVYAKEGGGRRNVIKISNIKTVIIHVPMGHVIH